MSYKTVITNIGLAKIADAIANSTPLTLATMKLGDGNGNPVLDPSPSATALVRQVWSGSLSYLDVDPTNPNRFIAEAVVPAITGGWTVREVGICDSLGNLIVNANFPEVYKPGTGEGATRDLVVRIYFEVVNADAIEIVFDPSVVVASRSWVESNFNLVALLPGGTTGQVLRKKSNTDGDTEWFDPTTGLNVIVDVIQEEQTLAASQTIVNLVTAGTDGAAFYVEGVRLHPGDYTINTATRITLAESYPAGSKILIVQNDPGSGFSFLRQANNLSDVASKQTSRANLGFPNATDGAFMTELWKALNQFQYPVGEIFITRQAGNPATILGFGTWERYGSGRTIVSLDPGDPSFNTVDLTGGAKTHTLSDSELPSHFHVVPASNVTTSSGGAHSHFIANPDAVDGPYNSSVTVTANNVLNGYNNRATVLGYALSGTNNPATIGNTSTSGTHSHTLSIPAANTQTAGGGAAHNNLQPYIVLNIWKRTA